MKLFTLNTHSLMEENGDIKLQQTADTIAFYQPDIIALQEVNQRYQSKEVTAPESFIGDTKIKSDNYALHLYEELKKRGISYYWCWLPIKIGYDKFDEGIAFLSRYPINKIDNVLLSKQNDYTNWKTRRSLGIQVYINSKEYWFYNVHMGWWNDLEEPFSKHWKTLQNHIKLKTGRIYLMGDFNSRDDIQNEGYTCIQKDGWYDLYINAKTKDDGITAYMNIDGWEESNKADMKKGMRIDYIFCNEGICVQKHQNVLNGKNGPIVSDHFAIYVEE